MSLFGDPRFAMARLRSTGANDENWALQTCCCPPALDMFGTALSITWWTKPLHIEGNLILSEKKQSKRLHRKDPLNLRCFEDDSMTDVRMRMCSSFLHEGGERIAKAHIMYQDVSGCFTEVVFETMPQSRYSRPRDHNPAKAPSMNILWPCRGCLLA